MSKELPLPGDVRLRTIYERVRHHLLEQGCKSEFRYPMYHAPDGNRCAIGILIQDYAYAPELEVL